MIKFGTYNIRNGRNRGLESALRGMAQANIDLGVFQETKCTDGANNPGPVASKHCNLISLLNASSMALGSTTGRKRH